ncbi:hypothetical protein FOL46_001303, partial [Perkinsus olseni]
MVKLAEGEPDRNCGPAGIAIGSSRWTPKMPLGTSAWRGRMLSFCLWQSNETDVRGETNRTRRGRSSTTTTMIMRAILSLLCVLYVDDGSWASCDATCLKDFLAVIVLSKWDLHTGKLSIPDEKLELIGGQGDYVLRRLTWATQCFTRYRCHLAPIFAWLKAVKRSNVCDKIRLLLGLLRSEQIGRLRGLQLLQTLALRGSEVRFVQQSSDTALRKLMGDTFVSGDISRLELFAIVLGLLIVGEIQGESEGECTILSDNTAAIHVVNKGSSSVPRMAELWARLVACRRVGRQVRAFHVAGRVARALGRRVPVTKFIERLLGASVGELPVYFTGLSMDPHIAGKVAQMLESRCPQVYGGASSRLELAEASEASRVQSVAVRPAVRSGGAVRSSFTHSRQRTGSGSEPYALRPSVRIVGSKSRGIPAVSTDTMSMVLAAARAPSTNRKYTCIERRYMDLMVRMNIPPWPLSGYSLVAYVSALVREGRVKAETVVDYVGKLQCSSRRFAEDISGPAKEMVRLAVLGANRILGWQEPLRARTLTKSEIRVVALSRPQSGRQAAPVVFLVGVCGLLRLRELVELDRNSVTWVEHEGMVGSLFASSYEELDLDLRDLIQRASS